jgi:hypothetical protein
LSPQAHSYPSPPFIKIKSVLEIRYEQRIGSNNVMPWGTVIE